MYRIIGTDGKHYGPVSIEQLRRWIGEGRINAQTLVQAEGSQEWKALNAVPELAGELKAPPLPRISGSAACSQTSNKIAAGVCGILLGSLGIHKFILGYTGAGLIMLLVTILTCGFGGIVMHLIGLIEGIIYLTKSDEEFIRTYVEGRKEWF
jgi:TM2 domain-containing membrane protein YozV